MLLETVGFKGEKGSNSGVNPECFLLEWFSLDCWVPPWLSVTIPQPGLGRWQPLSICCGCCFADLLCAERGRS